MLNTPQATGGDNDRPVQSKEIDATLNQEIIDDLARELAKADLSEAYVAELRQRFPDVRFILCSEDDMGEREPYLALENVDLHLMAAQLGCACLTNNPEQSIGLILATREED
ncbi:DUF6129 family protein [Corallincola platygyrae]|uniref:DUF6129 family protein n=1 Tax=Corallincola platygyrae TaxID=1193278 RepID=A0ABW4XGC9_9GAMM